MLLYVDEMLVAGSNMQDINVLKKKLGNSFAMKDLGAAKKIPLDLHMIKGKENLVCRLKKRLYGLKQAPRKWYLKFDRFMTKKGFSRCHSDHCVYFKRLENGSYM